jgi:hypothetical protein
MLVTKAINLASIQKNAQYAMSGIGHSGGQEALINLFTQRSLATSVDIIVAALQKTF